MCSTNRRETKPTKRMDLAGSHWRGDHHAEIHQEGPHKVAYISARALDIIWGNDTRFWKWVPLREDEARRLNSNEGAELIQVNWVEVKGTLDADNLSPSTTYEVLYKLKFKDDAFGWHSCPITFQVTSPHGQKSKRTLLLEPYSKMCIEWHEIHGGEFSLAPGSGGKVEFSMHGDESAWWKGGMVLGGVSIMPKPA